MWLSRERSLIEAETWTSPRARGAAVKVDSFAAFSRSWVEPGAPATVGPIKPPHESALHHAARQCPDPGIRRDARPHPLPRGCRRLVRPSRYELMILLAAWGAMRFGELTELRRSDRDLKNGVIKIRRGGVGDGLERRAAGRWAAKVRRRRPRRQCAASSHAVHPRALGRHAHGRARRAAVPRGRHSTRPTQTQLRRGRCCSSTRPGMLDGDTDRA